MGILVSVTTVIFVILCVLLVILILLQSDKSAGMGILGGSSQSAFGSSTADVITKITATMVGIFMVASLGLAVMESAKSGSVKKELMKAGKASSTKIENTVGDAGAKTPASDENKDKPAEK